MFVSRWSWMVPLGGAVAVFLAVLLTTPPGLRAVSDSLIGSARGGNADATAYALGAAGSLALVALLVLSLIFGVLDLARRR